MEDTCMLIDLLTKGRLESYDCMHTTTHIPVTIYLNFHYDIVNFKYWKIIGSSKTEKEMNNPLIMQGINFITFKGL